MVDTGEWPEQPEALISLGSWDRAMAGRRGAQDVKGKEQGQKQKKDKFHGQQAAPKKLNANTAKTAKKAKKAKMAKKAVTKKVEADAAKNTKKRKKAVPQKVDANAKLRRSALNVADRVLSMIQNKQVRLTAQDKAEKGAIHRREVKVKVVAAAKEK